MPPTTDQRAIVERFAGALETGQAALFAGAGLSASAGCVDWRGFSEEFARDLGLDVDRESDLVAILQYHINERRCRDRVVAALEREFSRACSPTPNHHLLARLPLHTLWTTNYDRLLEIAFEAAGKVVDVKIAQDDFTRSPRGDVTLYKMHGCVTRAAEAIVAKDDYEQYEHSRSLFVDRLKSDLISRTFLFLGFSFKDPNIDYILSRVRVLLGRTQREHLCIMRRPPPAAGTETAEEARRIELRVGDLRRFGIETAFVSEYDEIDELLTRLASRVHRRNVFVSAAAAPEGRFVGEHATRLCRLLGTRLVAEGLNLVTAFDHGPSEQATLGAIEAWHREARGIASDRVIARAARDDDPPPSASGMPPARRDLLLRAGSVVLLGGGAGRPREPDVRGDAEAARCTHRHLVPVGATGGVAREVWSELASRDDRLGPLGDARASDEELVDRIVAAVRPLARGDERG